MDAKTNDTDTDQAVETFSGLHALFTLVESLMLPHKMYVRTKSLYYSKHSIICMRTSNFIFIFILVKHKLKQ